ncbi:MAG: hypothetical protein ABTA24_03065 [Arthrobacter sp.]
MNRKQRGAATKEEQARAERGWFDRLRSQPGFRTAFVAFCLTVVLGVGAPAAYALWSSTVTANVNVPTAKPPLPGLSGDVRCGWNGIPLFSNVIITQPRPAAALPAGAVTIMIIDEPRGQNTYALTTSGSVRLVDVPGLENRLRWGNGLTISMTTAYVSGPAPGHLESIDASRILEQAAQAPSSTNAYYYSSFLCNPL